MIIETMKSYNKDWEEHKDAFTELLNRPEKYINRVFDISIVSNEPTDPLWYICVLKSVYMNGKQTYAFVSITDNHLDSLLNHIKIIEIPQVRAFGLHEWSIEGFIMPNSILFDSFLKIDLYNDLEVRTYTNDGIPMTRVTIDGIPKVIKFINNFEIEIE